MRPEDDPKSHRAIELSSEPEERRRRRSFSPDEKLRILEEVDSAPRGQRGAVLRKHGIYSSHLVIWRKAMRERGREGLAAKKPGPAPSTDKPDARDARIRHLERELLIARELMDLQKKASRLLGIILPEPEEKKR